MWNKAIIIICIVFFINIEMLPAQELWDLNRCISYTLENNLDLKNASLNVDLQRINLNQSRNNQLPYVRASVGINESFGRSVDPKTNTYADINSFSNSYGIGASVDLFSGFAQRNRIAYERFSLKAEKNRYEQQKNSIIYSTIDAYYLYLLTKGIYILANENLSLMQDQHYSTKRLIEVGRKAESDIFEFDAKLATDSFLFIQQQGNMEKALLSLKKIMNFPILDTLSIDSAQIALYPFSDSVDVKNITEVAKNQLPNLKITENELLAAKKYLAQVKGSFAPSISLSAGWNTGYYKNSEEVPVQFKTQFKNNAGEYIGASLSIPIFAKFSRINSVKQANINYKKMEIAHEENIAFLENEVNAAYINWTVSKNEFVSAQKQLDKSIIAYKSAEKKLALGQINVIDFYIQKNEMFRAKTELLRTRVQLALQDKYLIFLFTGNWN